MHVNREKSLMNKKKKISINQGIVSCGRAASYSEDEMP